MPQSVAKAIYTIAMAMNLARLENSMFQQILGESSRTVEDAVIAQEIVGESSLDLVAGRLAELLGVTKGEVFRLLGVSRTKVSRNPRMDVQILDRAGSTLKILARLSSMVGEESAVRWLSKPNPHLSSMRPLELLGTRLGYDRVEDLVTALEDGVFL